jgi:hypothetical protein
MVDGKLPPHDIEAEEAVIGSLLIDADAILKIGRYIEMTTPPITTPKKTMRNGSRREVKLPTATSLRLRKNLQFWTTWNPTLQWIPLPKSFG